MDIRVIDNLSQDSHVGRDIHELVRTQLANDQSLASTLRQIGFSSGRTLLIGGFVDGRLATMNAFMPQQFAKGRETLLGYESGFSATGAEHRGKGYWPKLLTAGMDLLRERGGHFVYGLPNPVSHPLFEKKLGFATSPMWRTLLPAISTRVLSFNDKAASGFYRPDLMQAATSKRREGDVDLVQVGSGGHIAFGKIRSSRGLRYIDVGGLADSF